MRTTYLKLLVGLAIVIGIANASSTAAASMRPSNSPVRVECDLSPVCNECTEESNRGENVSMDCANLCNNPASVCACAMPNDCGPEVCQMEICTPDIQGNEMDPLQLIV